MAGGKSGYGGHDRISNRRVARRAFVMESKGHLETLMAATRGSVHVSPQGDDTGDGSEARPFYSVEVAVALARETGRTVVLRGPGLYDGKLKRWVVEGVIASPRESGAAPPAPPPEDPRERARRAWDHWTEEDRKTELAAMKSAPETTYIARRQAPDGWVVFVEVNKTDAERELLRVQIPADATPDDLRRFVDHLLAEATRTAARPS
jgi:hypothetical protein